MSQIIDEPLALPMIWSTSQWPGPVRSITFSGRDAMPRVFRTVNDDNAHATAFDSPELHRKSPGHRPGLLSFTGSVGSRELAEVLIDQLTQ